MDGKLGSSQEKELRNKSLCGFHEFEQILPQE
jgi:hypothetical protein